MPPCAGVVVLVHVAGKYGIDPVGLQQFDHRTAVVPGDVEVLVRLVGVFEE